MTRLFLVLAFFVTTLFVGSFIVGDASGQEKKNGPPTPKDVKKDEPVGDQAILPVNLVRNRIETMLVGTSMYVLPGAVRVDVNRKCWLHPQYVTGVKTPERMIQVRREDNGYHAVLEGTNIEWTAEDYDGVASKWIPLKTFTVKE